MAKKQKTRSASKPHSKTSPVKAKRTSRARTVALSSKPATKVMKKPVPTKHREATRRVKDRAPPQLAMENVGARSKPLNSDSSPTRTPLPAAATEKLGVQVPNAPLDNTLHAKSKGVTSTHSIESGHKFPMHGFSMIFMPLERMVQHQAYVFNLMLQALQMQKRMWQPFSL